MEKQSIRRLNILLVEDDELNQRIFCLMFDTLGHRVDIVFNGAEGVAAVRDGNYDLVFMDVRMPIMDGLEATRKIRALDGERKNIPIIALTASNLLDEEKLCLEAGMNDHTPKPLNLSHIKRVLDAYRDGHYQPSFQVDVSPSVSPLESPLLVPENALPFFDEDILQYKMFLREFLTGLPDRIQNIEIGIRTENWKQVANEAHNLKGISAYLGAMRLSAFAASLDQLVGGQDAAQAEQILNDIKNVAAELVEQVNEIK